MLGGVCNEFFWAVVSNFLKLLALCFALEAKQPTLQVALTAATLVAVGVKGFMQAKTMLAKGQDILANKTSAGWKDTSYLWNKKGWCTSYLHGCFITMIPEICMWFMLLSVGECDEILGRTIELRWQPIN